MAVRTGIAQNIAVRKAVDMQADRATTAGTRPEQHTERVGVTISPSSFALFGRFAPDDKFCQHEPGRRGRHD